LHDAGSVPEIICPHAESMDVDSNESVCTGVTLKDSTIHFHKKNKLNIGDKINNYCDEFLLLWNMMMSHLFVSTVL
jgi:hypothetical protein